MRRKRKALLSTLIVMLLVFNSATVGMAYTPDLTSPRSGAMGNIANPSYAFDDNDSTFANSYTESYGRDDSKTRYCYGLGYDFGAGNAKRIRSINIKQSAQWNYGVSMTGNLQFSDDGVSWTAACTFSWSTDYNHMYEVPDVGAHRFWMLGGPRDVVSTWRVYELELMEVDAPKISITKPSINEEYSNFPGHTQLGFRGSVSCPGATSTVYFNVDGDATKAIPGVVTGSGDFTAYDFDITGYAAGTHYVNIWATNNYGMNSPVVSIPIGITQTIPTLSVASPLVNQMFSNKIGFNKMSLSGNATSQGWNSSIYYRIDSSAEYAVPGIVANSGSYLKPEIEFYALSEGNHTIYVRSENNQTPKLTSAVKAIPFKVDFTPPTITKIGATTAANSITVLTEATDAVAGLAAAPCRYTASAPGMQTVDSGWVSSTSYTLSGLTPNTTYAIRQQVKDGVDNISEQTVKVTTRAQTPAIDVKTNGITSDITITDSNPVDITKYKIISGSKFVDQSGQLTASPTWLILPVAKKITVTGLNSNLGYGFRASAMGTDGIETELSDTRIINPVAPPPAAPTLLKALAKINETTKNNEITVYWDPISDATGYVIEIDGVETPTNNGLKTEYTQVISGLKQTTHKYRIKTLRDTTVSPWSEYITATTIAALPTAPSNLTFVSHATSVALNWDAVQGATGYELLMDGVVKDVGYKLLYTNKHLSPDTLHTYAIRAKNAAGFSPWTEMKVARTTSDIPTVPVINFSRVTNTQATVAWDEGMDAESYDVEVDGVISDCGIYNFCMKSYLNPTSTHVFRARAKNAIGESVWSQPVSITTYLLDTPQNVSIIEEDTKLSLKWKGVPDAEKYILSLNGAETDMGKVEAYEVKELTPETEYKVKIKAINATGTGNWTDERTVHSLPTRPAKPQNISLLVVPNYVSLSWDAVEGATSYDVELDGVVIDNDTATTYIDEALEPNTSHIFRVRAKNTAIESEWSDNKLVTTLNAVPAAPVVIQISTTKNIASIMWDKVLGAIGYNIEVDGTEIVLGDNNVYTHRRLVEGTEHRYRLKSKFVNGDSPWTGDIINNSILAICKKSKTVDLGLTAQDISDFSKYTLTVVYDPKAMTVADLCTLSSGIELNIGKVKGTDIWIKEFTPGKIVFVATKVVNQGESWTGVINSIKFNAKVSGRTAITYTVFTAADKEE